ncbi:MAG: sugar phosphate isomerase/epimerase [Tannerellaceae bacterium]|jgi:sugar phosphate isomerase/epimerase|nr:sugar phosphate isomerase/epimerase [Tannerellaceae bacterium]
MNNRLSRRKFLGGSAAALAAASFIPATTSCRIAPFTPPFPGIDDFGSKFSGVQIGAITYSWRSMSAGLENIIKYCKETGINSIELMSTDLETFLGAPENPMRNMRRPQPTPPPTAAGQQSGTATPPPAARPDRRQLSPEEQAAMDKYNADIKEFRLGVSAEKVAAARKLFDDAGIEVHIVKFSPSKWSDEEIDYAFTTAKAMGAKAVCEEISESAVKKLAPFAEKHGMYAIFHNHMQYAEEGFSADPFLAVSPAVMLNFDSGHYFGSTGLNPCDFIRKYHDRIYSIHIKDKTAPVTEPGNTNQVWGQGETPLKELLLMMKQEGWPIYLDIELEYEIAPWSDAVKEVKTCVQYSRNILI